MFRQPNWQYYFNKSIKAKALEKKLQSSSYNLRLIEYRDGSLASSAHTDVKAGIISLNVTQEPLKTALSYAYELKNFDNREKLSQINRKAEEKIITKSQYVHQILLVEAEALHFRCQVYKDIIPNDDSLFPNNKEYLQIYYRTRNVSENQAIQAFEFYMKEYGFVRGRFSAKKYYADAYDFYAFGKDWPEEYDLVEAYKALTLK